MDTCAGDRFFGVGLKGGRRLRGALYVPAKQYPTLDAFVTP